MSDKVSDPKKITIDKTTSSGGDSGKDLDGCYFQPTGVRGAYNFFSRHGVLLVPDLRSGRPFNFNHDKIAWDVYRFKIDENKAEGDWKNNAPGLANEQEGTFTAQSGGGVVPEEEDAGIVCVHPANAIEIKSVTGGTSKDKLKKCYFLPATGSTFELFDKDCKKLKSGLTDGTDFIFSHDSITWDITNFAIDDKTASGYWKNDEKEQEGTFLAQSGGGIGEGEEAASASA